MNNSVVLKIDDKQSVTLGFGYGLFRLLGEKWGLPGINSVIAKFSVFEKMDGDEISFEAMDILTDLVLCSAEFANPNIENYLDSSNIADYFMSNPKSIESIMTALIDSLPKVNQNTGIVQGKKLTAKTTNKKN